MANNTNNADDQLSGNTYVRLLGRPKDTIPVTPTPDSSAEKEQEPETEPAQKKKLTRREMLLLGGGVAAAIAVPAIFISQPWKTEDKVKETAPASFTLTEEDTRKITDFIESFMKSAGNFGVDDSKLTPATIRNVRYLVKTKNSGYNAYLRTRADAYRSVRSSIWEGSPVYYDAETVSRWNKESYLEDARMPTFQVRGEVKVHFEPSGTYYIDSIGTTHRRVSVEVDFTSIETVRVQEADGVGSDGAFAVLEKEHPAVVKMELVESNDKWYLYSQSGTKQYLLATWAEFKSSDYAESQNTGFTKVGTIVPTDNSSAVAPAATASPTA